MDASLRRKLIGAAGAGALVVAGILGTHFEGREKRVGYDEFIPYVDPVGVLTVCEGVTGPEVIRGKVYSGNQCDDMELKHRLIAERAVKRQINDYATFNQWRQGSLIDFAYNVGEGNMAASTLKRRFNAGDAVGGCRELTKWVKGRVRGVLTTLRGLVTRRDTEMELCMGGGDWK